MSKLTGINFLSQIPPSKVQYLKCCAAVIYFDILISAHM